ncbi:aryl-sulfate sulfotransferase [Halorarius halobius]|uniref:aryl-sulfate sulfotransferase n=1 Tax=Halorarius halobius TaxID=2962671 RepID=UPI0020CEDAA7|nr:aryl-sulfate sulfotransferase [Halorarius halobius]
MEQSRRTLARGVTALLVVALLVPAGVSAVTYDPTDFQRGHIEEPANGSTVVGIQGFHFQGQGAKKKPARLASIGPNGSLNWQFDGSAVGARWFYDVDPLENGNLLVVSTNQDGTIVYEFDPERKEAVWTERFDIHDTHDVDKLPNGDLVVANMRQYNETTGVSNDRVFVYNRSTDEITWEWLFRNHYPNSTDGGFNSDWSHVNDVDRVGDDHFLVSPRNFDQVILINRTTKEIDMRLGSDDDYSVLHEQHNPDWLVSAEGNPTIVVADSENDRVVEYERRCTGDPMDAPPEDCSWNRTWSVGSDQFNWPRDADRLPNGNTLVTDSLNHRVVEITPDGEIVWEYYATWGPYDAERVSMGGSSKGPTIADMDAGGTYDVTGSANDPPVATESESGPGAMLASLGFTDLSRTWSHVTPWAKPIWMGGWAFVTTVLAGLVLVGWGVTEMALHRGEIRRRVRRLAR